MRRLSFLFKSGEEYAFFAYFMRCPYTTSDYSCGALTGLVENVCLRFWTVLLCNWAQMSLHDLVRRTIQI